MAGSRLRHGPAAPIVPFLRVHYSLAAANTASESQHHRVDVVYGGFDALQFLRDAAGHNDGRRKCGFNWRGHTRIAPRPWRFRQGGTAVGLASNTLKTIHMTNAWHESSGGIGTFYRALLEAANREGHLMRLIVPGPESKVEKAGRFGLIYYLKARIAPINHSYRVIYPHRFLFPGTAIQKIINDENPDLIEISEKYTLNYLGGLLRTRRLPGVSVQPVVVGASHERMDENVAAYVSNSIGAQAFARWYMKRIYFPMFDHHITFSEHTAGELIEASKGHKVRRGIWITPMGVDCTLFRPVKKPARPDGITRMLYAGRVSPEKNVMLLAELMDRLDPAHFSLTIAGQGTQLEEIQRRGLPHISFAGHVKSRERLAEMYSEADIFVHPNPREPFGIAPLEALAAGLALVVPNSGGVTSYANDDNAWLTSADAGGMAAAVHGIVSNPELRAARITAGRQTAERFDWPVITARFLRLYEEIVTTSRDAAHTPVMAPRVWSTKTNFTELV